MTVAVQKEPEFDWDAPIFRVFPLWFFEQALQMRSLTFVRPSRWDDPFEDVSSNVAMTDERTGQHRHFTEFLTPAYAQCWSFESNSDTLIRAYSQVSVDPVVGRNRTPYAEGVRVASSPRKIIKALKDQSSKHPRANFYVGKVRYCSSDEISQFVTNGLGAIGAARMALPDHRADTLFLKDSYYRHESELRVLVISRDRSAGPEFFNIEFDPNLMIDAVEFDPRLRLFERNEREAKARTLGYVGPFTGVEKSLRNIFNVVLPNGWGPDEAKPENKDPEPPKPKDDDSKPASSA
ncbi:hypothetical protein [Mesorhizobium sp. M1B.F.Ca.ET.045.04.1.1]|uniref:hypothetical protein n=1 Tax=Mesorhizobium sp. M1B.F.Ca.ET.045.04.1.1 TaxID=2493673 RepID=UPI000F764595|nr:hypothetical protein [Mesorhizobium sp. M1B.F.Ca.ET.045.04.1.1]AZO29776.1 hypothetical protein EJ071_21830 [Mesorhizobium sp. M1B.F.Ca.ET.045.04.1.1]